MKKIIVRAILCLFLLVSTAGADETTTVSATAKMDYSVEGTYNTISTEAPNLLHAGKIDGSNVGVINAYWNKVDGDKDLPKYLADQGWHIWKGTDWHKNGITVSELENLGSSWWDYSKWFRAIGKPTGISPIETSKDALMPFSFWPIGSKKVSIVQIHVEKGSELVHETIADAWHKAWEKGGYPKYFIILYKITPISNGFVQALGTAATTGIAHGPEAEAGKRATSGAFGSGFGNAQGLVWNGEDVMVIGWDKFSEEPKKETTKEWRKKFSTAPKFINSPELRFDFDSSEIYTSEQLATIDEHAKILAEILPDLSPRQKIVILGGASEEGTNNYNIVLGKDRAEKHRLFVGQVLHQVYGLPEDFILGKIEFASIGECFPKYNGTEKDRRTLLTMAETL